MTSENGIIRYSASANTAPPARLNTRYSATRFLPEAGNTVVCHLDRTHPDHQAVLDARSRVMALPGAACFLFTPVESLHMTLFEGVIETRRNKNAWPAGMSRDASVSSVTAALLPRFDDFQPLPAFNVQVTDLSPTGLRLAGASPEDEVTMRAWRDALTEVFGYRHDDHDAYWFHMTFAYPVAWLPDDLVPLWQSEIEKIRSDLMKTTPVLPLHPPAFCTFADMTAFPQKRILHPKP